MLNRFPKTVALAGFVVLLLVLGFLVGTASSQHPQNNSGPRQEITSTEPKHKTADDRLADYTLALDWLTFVLALATVGLGIISAVGIKIQVRDTRILQRAYIAVEPRGINSMLSGAEVIGHVAIRNAGNLPAEKLAWFINMKYSPKGDEFVFSLEDAKGRILIAPDAEAVRGSEKRLVIQDLLAAAGSGEQAREIFIYVWGIVCYQDGFGNNRKTEFCHRYNWVNRGRGVSQQRVGWLYEVTPEYARHHEHGNDAD